MGRPTVAALRHRLGGQVQADAASAAFARGTTARDNADSYVRDTVLFAAVLFLVAITQRFKLRNIRIATTAVALRCSFTPLSRSPSFRGLDLLAALLRRDHSV